jgi:hypothetical protein
VWLSLRKPSGLTVGLVVLVVAAVSCTSSGSPSKPSSKAQPSTSAAVVGPASTLSSAPAVGHISEPISASPVVLPPGYVEQEFFASGNAKAYTAVATPSDGRWTVSSGTTAPYRTRIIVRRPSAQTFNGTVVVEWMNVSAGESSPDWTYLTPELTSEGNAYVAVSDQELGVNGGKSILGAKPSAGLATAQPARYGSLHHPGDQYSYDIFAQIGQALRISKNSTVLGGLHPKRVVAIGESQSAIFLTTFVNAIQPLTHPYDGFFIHSRGGAGAPLDGSSITAKTESSDQQVRTDLTTPVFIFETETDLTRLGYAPARQPNSASVHTWEVAGTAHADTTIVGSYAASLGCTKPVNDGPQHVVVQAAFGAFAKWLNSGTLPPTADRLILKDTTPATFVLDTNGEASGGVRTPAVDVPVSTLSGVPPVGVIPICSLFGSSVPFTRQHLLQIYGSRSAYLARYQSSLDKAIKAGFILPADRAVLIQRAEAVNFG